MATVATSDLLKDAALIVAVCFSVEEGDVVTIICDDDRADEAAAVAEVCVERGAWPVIMNNELQVRRGRADVRFPMAPPANLHRAMVGSDEVIIIANLEWANRFAHVNAVRETCEANGKIASIEPGMGEWGLTREDLERSAQRTMDAVAALAGKKQCHVTTPLGTDFYVSIEGRPPLELTPYKARGQMMSPIPLWTEVAFAAIEDFTHGTAVVDGVMLGIGLEGQVKEPIRWTLEGGKCVQIEGGEEAERLRTAIAGVENAAGAGSASCLGYSVFTPGTVTASVRHETEEVAYVVAGSGELRLDDGAVPFGAGQALHIEPGVWHAVANTGAEDVAMVFGF